MIQKEVTTKVRSQSIQIQTVMHTMLHHTIEGRTNHPPTLHQTKTKSSSSKHMSHKKSNGDGEKSEEEEEEEDRGTENAK